MTKTEEQPRYITFWKNKRHKLLLNSGQNNIELMDYGRLKIVEATAEPPTSHQKASIPVDLPDCE